MAQSFLKYLLVMAATVFFFSPATASEGQEGADELASLLKSYESYRRISFRLLSTSFI